ncbi:DUF58 domain-containing protein [Bacteroidota bacterium]|nr:DUF58 domain-containing protein [Bacteroidota bacterium]MDC3129925.1 DUF58 domain-containing protein [Bacteroidota bacterium]
MDTKEILKKVRSIEIKTKGLSNHIFAGEYNTAFKGRGMTFSEVREYEIGDDLRTIDWNVTARYNSPFVKIFEEEREITLMLMVDVSSSSSFGTNKRFKRELVSEISAVLAFSAIKNNDKVGVIFFSDKIEKFISPSKGKKHILRIIKEILTFKSSSKKTNIKKALEYFNRVTKKRSICFLLSDFFDSDFFEPIKLSAKRHDLVAVNTLDKLELEIPNVGLLSLQDSENENEILVDSSDRKFRRNFKKKQCSRIETLKKELRLTGADYIQLLTQEDIISPLINFFKNRNK